MHINSLPERTQDYLKVLWNYEERRGLGAVMPLGELAKGAGQKLPTASEAVKRLAGKGLVEHEPYAGVRLTEEGRLLAGQMARRHRLVESFLVSMLGYSWDEVHEEADMLEHALSDRFVERVDAILGQPARDPHGDPIPAADGTAEKLSSLRLAGVPFGRRFIIEQVDDSDGSFLRYLADQGVGPGTAVRVNSSVAGMLEIALDDGAVFTIGESAAAAVAVHEPPRR